MQNSPESSAAVALPQTSLAELRALSRSPIAGFMGRRKEERKGAGKK